MQKYIVIILVLLAQFLHGSNNLKKVTIQLSWFDQFQFAGYYMAKEQGFYEELGLDVEIIPFEFGIDIPKSVNDGSIDFAVGRETLILEKINNKNIVALYALFQASPLILLTTKESKIEKITDFVDKKVMTTIDDASEVSIKSMITANKVYLSQLTFLKHTHNIEDLVNKNTDVMSGYISKAPFELQQMGIPYNAFSPQDYGFDMYSDFLYTNNTLLTNDLKTVTDFKKASLKGWEYAFSNIEQSVESILKKYNAQNLSKDALLYEAKELKKLSYLNNTKLGDMSLSKLQRIYDLYNIMGLVPKQINLADFVYSQTNFYSTLRLAEKEFIKENPIISIGQSDGFFPLDFYNDIGVHDGLVHDYFEIIAEKTGLRFVSDISDKGNLVGKLLNKKVDILTLPLDVVPDNTIVTPAYFKLHETSFKLKNKRLFSINNIGIVAHIEDLEEQKRIKDAYPNSKVVSFDTINDAVEALKKTEIEILYVFEERLLTFIKNEHINYIEYASTKIKDNTLPLFVLLNKDSNILQSILIKILFLLACLDYLLNLVKD
jgi:ABC-type nitrate/sulfonate/bicarbonate transport system substrate-binding protein